MFDYSKFFLNWTVLKKEKAVKKSECSPFFEVMVIYYA